MKQYYPLVDIIKFIFAILITCHHAEINLLINSGITSKIFGTSYLAVEGFLLISGYFLAASASSLVDKDGAWGTIIWKRIKRIYPVFLYCLLLFLIYDFVTYFVFGFHRYNFADIFSTIFMVGDVFFMKQIIGFWYMPVFLWCGFLYLYLLLYYPNISRKLLIPTIALLGYSWIYHQFGGLPLHIEPYVGSFMVGGLLRGLAGLALGIVLFEIQKNTANYKFKQTALICCWLVSLYATLKLSLHSNISTRDFNYIFAGSFLLLFSIKIQFDNEKLILLSKRLGILSYYIFLIHMLIIYIMIDFGINDLLSPAERLVTAFIFVLLSSIILMRYQNSVFNFGTKLFNSFLSKSMRQ